MSAPTFVGAGAVVAGTGAVTVAWPAGHRALDLGLLIVESSALDANATPQDWSVAQDWRAVAGSPLVDVATAAGSRLQLLWKRAVTGLESAVTLADPGDHSIACLVVLRGGSPVGEPFSAVATAIKSSASTLATLPPLTVATTNSLVLLLCSRPNDSNNTSVFSNPVNGSLTQLSKRLEAGSNSGDGGGFALFTGLQETPGVVPATTVNQSVSTTNACYSLSLPPARRIARIS